LLLRGTFPMVAGGVFQTSATHVHRFFTGLVHNAISDRRATAVDREAAGGRHMDRTQRRDSAGERDQVALGILFLIVLSLWVALWAAPLPGI
jgi:hypothetical protein